VEEPDSGGGAHLTEMCGVKQRGESGPAGCGSRKKIISGGPLMFGGPIGRNR
jgi:hypothetical protein